MQFDGTFKHFRRILVQPNPLSGFLRLPVTHKKTWEHIVVQLERSTWPEYARYCKIKQMLQF